MKILYTLFTVVKAQTWYDERFHSDHCATHIYIHSQVYDPQFEGRGIKKWSMLDTAARNLRKGLGSEDDESWKPSFAEFCLTCVFVFLKQVINAFFDRVDVT